MSDNERSRDRFRERDSRREPREGRERGGTPTERRNRSRSPRERGGRRDNRYRSRSPYRKDERDGGGRGGDRGRAGAGHDRGRGRDDRRGGRDDRSNFRDRSPQPPKGPRGSARGPFGGPVKVPTGPRSSTDAAAAAAAKEETPDVEMKDERQKPEDMDEDEWEMLKVMGFGGFKSTKNTKVPGNDKNYGVRKDKQLQARQYMNRQGGFNRPLSPSRS
jgi:U4/U6.U5 tri-snRNP-associated protein 3